MEIAVVVAASDHDHGAHDGCDDDGGDDVRTVYLLRTCRGNLTSDTEVVVGCG